METRSIKDFLHLYIGCGCVMNGDKFSMNEDYTSVVEWSDLGYPHNVKQLILRPLSDMTEDEAVELVKIQTPEKRHNSIDIQEITANHIWYIDGEMWYGDGVSELYDKYIKFNEISAEQFRYLLSRGFDLFNLIPEGLALDKTTLTQQ